MMNGLPSIKSTVTPRRCWTLSWAPASPLVRRLKSAAMSLAATSIQRSTFLVREELRHVDLWEVQREYERIDAEIGERIRAMHRTVLPDGEMADVLYYFWVMVVKSPTGEELPLFKNYVISKNAYPSKKPEIWVLCPDCGEVFQSTYTSHEATCPACGNEYDPWVGRVKGSVVTDEEGNKHKIKDLVNSSEPPKNACMPCSLSIKKVISTF